MTVTQRRSPRNIVILDKVNHWESGVLILRIIDKFGSIPHASGDSTNL